MYYITLASSCISLKAAESINPYYSTKKIDMHIPGIWIQTQLPSGDRWVEAGKDTHTQARRGIGQNSGMVTAFE